METALESVFRRCQVAGGVCVLPESITSSTRPRCRRGTRCLVPLRLSTRPFQLQCSTVLKHSTRERKKYKTGFSQHARRGAAAPGPEEECLPALFYLHFTAEVGHAVQQWDCGRTTRASGWWW
jgi:hypothetical protein